MPISAPPRTAENPQRRRSVAALGFLAAILLAAGLASVSPEQASWAGVEGPVCWLRSWFGSAACPGCGLTRSTALWLQGDFATSYALHPAGALVVLLCGAGIVVHLDVLRRGRRTPTHARLLRTGVATLAAGVVTGWLLLALRHGVFPHG